MSHFLDLFSRRVGNFISYLVEKKKPKKVVVCMIYYPCKKRKQIQQKEKEKEKGEKEEEKEEEQDEGGEGGWADGVLEALKYETFPQKLQKTIDLVYENGTKKVKIPGYNCKKGGEGWWGRLWGEKEEKGKGKEGEKEGEGEGEGRREGEGVVIPVALSDALDWRKGAHYDKRVEPSVLGGKRMAQHFFNVIFPELASELPEEC